MDILHCSPNFFIVGAAKSGTTSIAKYLSQHPEIYMPDLKEPKFFSYDDNIFPHHGTEDAHADSKVIKTIEDYRKLFCEGSNHPIKGEASVDYLYFQGVPKRIIEFNPNAKIIIILRHPVERAYSAYLHMVRDGRENLSFESALEAEKERKSLNWEFFWFYKDVGFYSSQVERYLEWFRHDQVCLILYEDLKNNSIKIIQEIFKFLGVNNTFMPDVGVKYNISGIPNKRWLHSLLNRKNFLKTFARHMLPKTIRKNINRKITNNNLIKKTIQSRTYFQLIDEYKYDIDKLQQIIDRDLSHWVQYNT